WRWPPAPPPTLPLPRRRDLCRRPPPAPRSSRSRRGRARRCSTPCPTRSTPACAAVPCPAGTAGRQPGAIRRSSCSAGSRSPTARRSRRRSTACCGRCATSAPGSAGRRRTGCRRSPSTSRTPTTTAPSSSSPSPSRSRERSRCRRPPA
ncbi:MAG: hypothetical protein AVDCRST_MAG07-503, partial [uncultured Frankineae bacterium]